MGDCKYCGQKAGFLSSKHRECETARTSGWDEMVRLAAEAAASSEFNETALIESLKGVAERSWAGSAEVHAAIVEGWRRGVRESLADGILTKDEESRLRAYRDKMALGPASAPVADARLEQAVRDRLVLTARMAALAVDDAESRLSALERSVDEAQLPTDVRRDLLVDAWEAAVEGALEDGVPTLDEEAALSRYLRHFGLQAGDVNANGAHRSLVEAAVIREAAEGIVPQRMQFDDPLPINTQKSEQVVWAFYDVDYHEERTRRERRGASHGVSIRIARGLYYSPRQFRSQTHEWEELVHVDTGMLALTNKHVYFHGRKKSFRVKYDKIVSFDMQGDGFGLMRDALSAKPQIFTTGDGWFVYNLVTNLARL